MCALRSPARRVCLVRGLGAVAVWWGPIVDSGQVRLVIGATPVRRDDVVNSVGSGSLADVADASVALQDTSAEAPPVRWEWGAAVSRHARIMPQSGMPSVRQVDIVYPPHGR